MKLLFEQWEKFLLREAAKNAKDLQNFHEENWMEHNEMIRGLWKKYGMWKLGDMMNIGIPDRVKRDWSTYSAGRQKRYTQAYYDAMLKKEPPAPIIMVEPGRFGGLEVSYGAVFPKYEEPAIILRFDSGVNTKAQGLMRKNSPMQGMPGGSIEFHKAKKNVEGECNDAWVVDNTHQTTDSWGPLLYDVAMEIATVLGGGLTSSRKMVSSMAKPVWDYYQDRRSDVDKDQLDATTDDAQYYTLKQLTPNKPEDDCQQDGSVKWAHGEDYGAWDKHNPKGVWSKMQGMSDEEKENVPWTDQSISKAYRKDPEIIKFLGDNGLLHFPQLGYDAVKYHTKKLPPLPPMEDEEPPPENDEMEKARSQFRSQTTLSENKIRIKIK